MFLYCLPGIADAGLVPVAAPKITCISESHLKLSCRVNPGFLKDETLVYWLVNNYFVETAFPNGTVRMSIIESLKSIQSDLIFQSAEDIRENSFTCVAMNPAGMDTKHFGGEQVRFSLMMMFKYNIKKKFHIIFPLFLSSQCKGCVKTRTEDGKEFTEESTKQH
ncbi:hypothetical protein IRJ41_009322 [Triplophysa rosa]|uniref:Ig-like domain-containing protein n=1 Tax=Triplophysa rosa TaxID=992332 RepID=A0A9W7TCB9_TRIRA|nr:hypothetical protein IRJ41_009322 [Triplophysa rosa]